MKKIIISMFSMLIFGMLVTACSGSQPQVSLPAGAAAGDLALSPCSFEVDETAFEADCGTLVVPENRAKPESQLIALPVTRVHAANGSPKTAIFYLEGGPGQSNMHARPPAALLENYDFVMVGYRGVDGSSVLDCPEVVAAIKGDGTDVLNAASLSGLAGAMQECAERLENTGVDLAGYTIQEVVGDMEAARDALGYHQINLISFSYGTRVAQIYAAQHPDRISRSALVSVNPPGHFVWEPETVDAQLAYYAELYAASETPQVPNLAETMREVVQTMPKRWLLLSIDPGKVKSVTFALLFHRNTAAMVFDAYLAAAQGDPSGLALMSLAYDFVIPGMSTWGEFFSKGVSADFDPDRDYAAEMDPSGSIIGAPLSALIWGSAALDGQVAWPTPLMPAELRQVQSSAVETLLVGGNVDFSTPVEFATEELLPSLANGQQVILAEMGHVNDVMLLQPEAITHLLLTFYETGTADDSLFTYAPMNFDVGLGFPAIAKLALLVLVIVVLGLGAGGWWAVRRVRKTQQPVG